jgi:hypothetical protein
MRALWRPGLWGISAALALAAAAWAAHSDFAAQRLGLAVQAEIQPAEPAAAQLLARSIDTDNETRRLAAALRTLSADRDRLIARLNTLERNLDEVTDSLAYVRSAQTSPSPSNNTTVVTAGAISAPLTPAMSAVETQPDPGWTVAVARPAAAAPPSSPVWPTPSQSASTPVLAYDSSTGSIPDRAEFGVDLGGGANFDALRALWASVKGKHAGLVEGLRPVVAIREGSRPAEMELRLVAGPLINAGAAARLCNLLAMAGLVCQPALFDGQRLAGIKGQ